MHDRSLTHTLEIHLIPLPNGFPFAYLKTISPFIFSLDVFDRLIENGIGWQRKTLLSPLPNDVLIISSWNRLFSSIFSLPSVLVPYLLPLRSVMVKCSRLLIYVGEKH